MKQKLHGIRSRFATPAIAAGALALTTVASKADGFDYSVITEGIAAANSMVVSLAGGALGLTVVFLLVRLAKRGARMAG